MQVVVVQVVVGIRWLELPDSESWFWIEFRRAWERCEKIGVCWRRSSSTPSGRSRGRLFLHSESSSCVHFYSLGSEKAFVALAALTLIGKPATVVCLLRNKAPESPQLTRSHPT